MVHRLIFGLGLASVLAACGPQKHSTTTSLKAAADQADFHIEGLSDNETYQIGTEMGKKPVTPQMLTTENEAFVRAAKATASTGSATAFYLGYYNGYHVMASNHHVYPRANSCLNRSLRFQNLENKRFTCTTFFGTWDEIDLSLFAIKVDSESDAQLLASVARNFDFDAQIYQRQNLVTLGFGIANNPSRTMMFNKDSDCKVFSKDGDYRLLADPDELNPGPYKAWSFSVGCDVSHGDSGSAMVDRETGSIVGIVWTGKIPKNARVRDAGYTDRILAEDSSDIWTELSLAVPAPKMAEFLLKVSNDAGTSAATAETLKALLAE